LGPEYIHSAEKRVYLGTLRIYRARLLICRAPFRMYRAAVSLGWLC